MANDSKTLFQSFVKKGMTDREAFFAVIDHFNQQHFYDRNSQHERLTKLEEKAEAGKLGE
jgi:hypothetical protein